MSNINLLQLESEAIVQQPGAIVQQPEAIVQQPEAIIQQPGTVIQQPGAVMQLPCLLLDKLDECLIAYCLQFLPIASFMRISKVSRFFHKYMSSISVRNILFNSFQFVNHNWLVHSDTLSIGSPDRFRAVKDLTGRRMPCITDISAFRGRSHSIAVMETFERRYSLPVSFDLARNAVRILNRWMDEWVDAKILTLQPLRLAGLFSSRSVRRYLINHLRRFYVGGFNQENSRALQLDCDDEAVGVSLGISAEMELLPEITYDMSEVHRKACPYVQYMGALLTRSYGVSFMRIDPVYITPGEGREVTGFFMDVTRTDVEALNKVFVELYPRPAFVPIRFD